MACRPLPRLISGGFRSTFPAVKLPGVKSSVQRVMRFCKRNIIIRGLFLVVGLGILIFSLGGCKLLMPAEIRNIEATLQKSAKEFQMAHPGAFHHYTVGSRMMAYVETGTTNTAPLVLFIHGSPGEWQGWVNYLADPELAARARLIAVDRPGFGGSGAGDAERSLEQQCRDMEPLLEQASPGQRVILVGHSFGGPIICRMAMDHPDIITDIIILAGSIDPGQEHTKWYQYPADWAVFRWMVPRELVTANREIRALKGGLNEMLPRWPEIHQRVTLIQGEADDLVPPENADFAERMMTNARPLEIIRLPGMNHFLPWKKYDLVKSKILQHTGS
jgi:pimeloyl-ACP methyl ester carboxylesterase